MWKIFTLTATALVTMAAMSLAEDAPPAKLAPGPVDVTGRLQTGIMAIGGETTGVVITIPGQGRYELDIRGNKELQTTADTLNGKQVRVKGTLSVKQGVEVKERRIIKVETLVEATAENT